MTSEIIKQSLKVGWIGTGVMGFSMCKHIINAGHQVSVYNRTISKTDKLVELGAVVSDPISIAKEVDFLFLIVSFPKDVETLVLGDNGVLSHMKKGSYLIDHTTSSPELAKKIYEEAKQRGIYSYDAPVTGGDVGAREGKLITFVGGDKEHYDSLRPLIQVYSRLEQIVGGAGYGQHSKLVNQISIASTIQGVCEALLYAYKAGLDVKQTVEMISQGAAGSTQLNVYAPRLLNRDMEAGFFVEHFLKDIKLALDESNRMGLDLKSLKLAESLYTIMVEDGLAKKGHHGLMLTLEKLNGISH